jgi:hypothetical protein
MKGYLMNLFKNIVSLFLFIGFFVCQSKAFLLNDLPDDVIFAVLEQRVSQATKQLVVDFQKTKLTAKKLEKIQHALYTLRYFCLVNKRFCVLAHTQRFDALKQRLTQNVIQFIKTSELNLNEALFEIAMIGGRYTDLIPLLIFLGANVNARDARRDNYDTPLMLAVNFNRLDVVDALLKVKGIDLHASEDGSGNTPLHLAAFKGRKKIAERLIRAGARQNIANSSGLFPVSGCCIS